MDSIESSESDDRLLFELRKRGRFRGGSLDPDTLARSEADSDFDEIDFRTAVWRFPRFAFFAGGFGAATGFAAGFGAGFTCTIFFEGIRKKKKKRAK
jgi:hypothetical protein